jgi:hypothetical protein
MDNAIRHNDVGRRGGLVARRSIRLGQHHVVLVDEAADLHAVELDARARLDRDAGLVEQAQAGGGRLGVPLGANGRALGQLRRRQDLGRASRALDEDVSAAGLDLGRHVDLGGAHVVGDELDGAAEQHHERCEGEPEDEPGAALGHDCGRRPDGGLPPADRLRAGPTRGFDAHRLSTFPTMPLPRPV